MERLTRTAWLFGFQYHAVAAHLRPHLRAIVADLGGSGSGKLVRVLSVPMSA